MCSDVKTINNLSLEHRKWNFLLRSAAVFFALFAVAEIIFGLLLSVYCFIPLDLLNIFGSIMLWRFSNPWRIYFIVVSALYVMLEWFTADLLMMLKEECGVLPFVVFTAMVLHIVGGIILLIYPGGRGNAAGK